MSPADRKGYDAHKSGTMKLQPFYENAMDDMAHSFLGKLTGKVAMDYKGIGSFGNSHTIQTKQMLDNDSTTYYTSGEAQKAGSWIGLDLRDIREVSDIHILQGRNSTDDVDYFDHAILEYSADGKTWTALTGAMKKTYCINWHGTPVKARYVRLRRLESTRTNYAAIRVFNVNKITTENLGFNIEAETAEQALRAFDNHTGTFFPLNGHASMEVKEGIRKYILLMNHPSSLNIKQLDRKGNVVSESQTDSPYAEINLSVKTAKVELTGRADIHEIIAAE